MERTTTISLIATIAILNSAALSVNAQKNAARPNVLIILADQWRGQAIGFENKEPVKTPYLDQFAKESLVLHQMVSNYPVCSPARAMLMTGKYPIKNRVFTNVNSASAPFGIELSKNAVCWSDILKANGYSNGYIGKWHLDSPYTPYVPSSNNNGGVFWNEWTSPDKRHGFDYWYAYGTYDKHNKPLYWDNNASRDEFHYVNQWGPVHEADKAISFMKNEGNVRHADGPFSLVVSMNPPHQPYELVPEKYYNQYKDIPLDSLVKDPNIPPAGTPYGDEYRKHVRYYYAGITGVDEQIGRILEGLKAQNLEDNTMVVIMSDHGDCLGKHDEITKNNIYEESLRIPFIVKWKGHIKPRIDDTFLGSIPDIYPTLLDLMGLKNQIPKDLDGTSYASYYINGTGPRPSEQFILGAINYGKINSGFRGIRTKDYKFAYINKKGGSGYVLFDLKADPFELDNIYNPEHKAVKELKPVLMQWIEKTNDSFILNKKK